jgi:O-antigen/teichoic acid export membrane protein
MSLRETAVAGLRWSAISVIGRRAVSLLTTIVMARLLPPEDFGLIAMAMAVIAFLEVFKDLGMGSAIVRWGPLNHQASSSVFWLTAALGLGVGLVLAASAPLIAGFFHEPRLVPLVRVLAICFPLSGSSVVPMSLLAREMRFRTLALVELLSAGAGTLTAIAMAATGHGVWSLAAQAVIGVAATSSVLLLVTRWRPLVSFHRHEMRALLRYSLPLAGFNTVNLISRNVDNVLIGRYLGAFPLGLYDLAYRLMLLPMQVVSWIANRVALPLYSQVRNENARISSAFLRLAATIAFITFPVMLGLAAVADLFISVLFGREWLGAATTLTILAPIGALQSVGSTTGPIFEAKGRTDILFRWGLLASAAVTASCAIGLAWGIVGVATCYALAIAALEYPKYRIVLRLVDLSLKDLAEALCRPFLCSLAMVLVVLVTKQLMPRGIDGVLRLSVLVVLGGLVYTCLAWAVNREIARDLVRALSGMPTVPDSERDVVSGTQEH